MEKKPQIQHNATQHNTLANEPDTAQNGSILAEQMCAPTQTQMQLGPRLVPYPPILPYPRK